MRIVINNLMYKKPQAFWSQDISFWTSVNAQKVYVYFRDNTVIELHWQTDDIAVKEMQKLSEADISRYTHSDYCNFMSGRTKKMSRELSGE
ncbi:MAG TPA: hypothetical protein ENH82_08710 [bacterium]|nr:hypothetical protein [bacterium]